MSTDSADRASGATNSAGDMQAPRGGESATDELARRLRAGWDSGRRMTIEELFAQSGDAAMPDAEQLLDLVYHEILIREDHGEAADEAEYLSRFPGLATRVRRMFEIHRAVESTDLEGLVEDQSARGRAPGASVDDASRAAQPGDSQALRSARVSLGPEIPGYELLGEIGSGGMAVVYKARQQPLGRIVAVKVLSAGKLASREVAHRFRQEAQTIASLQHPNIVQIHEVGEADGQPYVTLEFVAGGTLHDYQQHRPIAPMVAAELAEVLARTMDYAHSMGVVHRDLKPANVLLQTADGSDSRWTPPSRPTHEDSRDSRETAPEGLSFRPKIADFGLAKLMDMASDLTMTGHIVGTPGYMAPEQTGRAHEVGPAADIYSVGAILYELLTGHPPFQGVSSLEILDQVRNREPVSPRRLQPRVPRDLETICLKCLEKQPSRRYATAADLADDLRRVRSLEPIHARPARIWEQGWKWARRHPAVSLLMSLLLVVTVTGIGGIGWQFHLARVSAGDARDQRDHARRLHGVAVLERQEAERRRKEAEDSEARAVEAQRRAEANFDRAFALVNDMSNLADKMRATPYQDSAGWSLLEKSLVFYEGFLQERADAPQVRDAAIVSLLRAGQIRTTFGQHEHSLQALDRAIALLGPSPPAVPENVEYFRNLGMAHATAAINYRDLRRLSDAEAAFLAAIDARRIVVRLAPENVEHRRLHAITIVNYCSILRDPARRADAMTRFAEATELLEALVQQHPRDPRCLFDRSVVLDDFGQHLRQTGRCEDGEAALRRALAIREDLVVRNPASVEFVASRARSQHRLAGCHIDRREWTQARGLLEPAIASLRDAVDKFPHQMAYQRELRDALYTLADMYRIAGDPAGHFKAFDDLTRTAARIAGLFPGDVESARIAGEHGVKMAELQAERRAFDSARQEYQFALFYFESAVRRMRDSARSNNQLAWHLAACPYDSLRNPARARELAERAVRGSPGSASYWNTLGVAYEASNLPSLAVECYRRAIELDSGDDWRHQAYLARALALFGRADEAREILTKIAASDDVDDETAPVLEQARQAVQALEVDSR